MSHIETRIYSCFTCHLNLHLRRERQHVYSDEELIGVQIFYQGPNICITRLLCAQKQKLNYRITRSVVSGISFGLLYKSVMYLRSVMTLQFAFPYIMFILAIESVNIFVLY